MKNISKVFLYLFLAFTAFLASPSIAQQKVSPAKQPAKKRTVTVPSNAAASNLFTAATLLSTTSGSDSRIVRLSACIRNTYIHRREISDADAVLIEAELLKTLTQEEFNKMMSFDDRCKSDYASGIICPKSLGMSKLFAMYDKALKASNRKTAYAIFKRTDGEYPIAHSKTLASSTTFLTANVKTLEDAIGYMNEEMYYEIDPLAKVIAHKLIMLKQRQLIDNGYSVVYKYVNAKRQYSEGAELLLAYCNKLVDAFNSPYFLGLNSRLEEVGSKMRFNNKHLLNTRDAQELSKKALYGEVSLSDSKTRWMLRMTIGVLDYNSLINRINNGNKTLREAFQGKVPDNVKPSKR